MIINEKAKIGVYRTWNFTERFSLFQNKNLGEKKNDLHSKLMLNCKSYSDFKNFRM